MSDADAVRRRVRKPVEYTCGKDCEPLPGDEQIGAYSYEQRIRMDEKFTRAVLHAFETGGESRQAAANQIATPPRE
jgi:hypothetical protein